MGDAVEYADEVLVKDLRRWQQHAKLFVDFAKRTVEKSTEQQQMLTTRAEAAYSTMIEYVILNYYVFFVTVRKYVE
jgi:hypothetical protein